MNKCPICKNGESMHAPDGRCDSCAEEYGCECGCFPPILLKTISAHSEDAIFEQNDEGYWRVEFTTATGQFVHESY